MQTDRQHLIAHLKAAFVEIKRLRVLYSHAVEQLRSSALPNLTIQSASKWFEMYLRAMDLGVQIRRGEIRHRTAQHFTYACMHETGIKGAVHSGLSIDDGNSILQLLEKRKLVKESLLDNWFREMDILDGDIVGLIDKDFTRCLGDFKKLSSIFYDRVEVTGENLHQKILVLDARNGVAASILATITRKCFNPETCTCEEDAKPWENLSLESADSHDQNHGLIDGDNNTKIPHLGDVGITEIKRQLGFQQHFFEEKIDSAMEISSNKDELVRRTVRLGQIITAADGQSTHSSAISIYEKMSEENGFTPNQTIKVMLAPKAGSHYLDLSDIGFHSAHDLQALIYTFSSSSLPPVKLLDLSCGYFNTAAFQVLCELLEVPLIRQTIERLSLRGIAVPTHADFAILMRILTNGLSSSTTSLPALTNLKTLDISFNTFVPESAAQLQPLLSSLKHLEDLSLESCFPDSASSSVFLKSSSYREEMKISVQCALADVSTRLDRLNFGSNTTEMCWLDAIFMPESTLRRLDLNGVSRPILQSGDSIETMKVDWQTSEQWDLQHLERLKWSSGNIELSEKLFGALSSEFQSGFIQMKHLDIAFMQDADSHMEKKFADAILGIADFAELRSCRIRYSTRAAISQEFSASVANLFKNGLQECIDLELYVPQLHLTKQAIFELLSNACFPKMHKMNLAVGVATDDSLMQPIFTGCFLQMQKAQELKLDFHVAINKASEDVKENIFAFARELKASWLRLSSFDSLIRSFDVSENQKIEKWICRSFFLANPAAT
ncbi:uncharacterized protein CCR75_002407 [Bremia lactucae]|uniref:Uncharacterized protein n=1 Tax=Bremia lactucae TaxID=4779 RepID=A0A976IKE0_BRELC|nr:hypothetical protein CCR75_002407 [Bremia lactucae]